MTSHFTSGAAGAAALAAAEAEEEERMDVTADAGEGAAKAPMVSGLGSGAMEEEEEEEEEEETAGMESATLLAGVVGIGGQKLSAFARQLAEKQAKAARAKAARNKKKKAQKKKAMEADTDGGIVAPSGERKRKAPMADVPELDTTLPAEAAFLDLDASLEGDLPLCFCAATGMPAPGLMRPQAQHSTSMPTSPIRVSSFAGRRCRPRCAQCGNQRQGRGAARQRGYRAALGGWMEGPLLPGEAAGVRRRRRVPVQDIQRLHGGAGLGAWLLLPWLPFLGVVLPLSLCT